MLYISCIWWQNKKNQLFPLHSNKATLSNAHKTNPRFACTHTALPDIKFDWTYTDFPRRFSNGGDRQSLTIFRRPPEIFSGNMRRYFPWRSSRSCTRTSPCLIKVFCLRANNSINLRRHRYAHILRIIHRRLSIRGKPKRKANLKNGP